MIIASQDSTERKRLHDFFMQLPTPTCVLIGSEHRFLMANPAYEEFFRRSVVGQCVREVFTSEELGHYLPLLDQVHETGTPYVGRELLVKRLNEFGKIHEHWVDLGLYPYEDHDLKIKGVQVLIYDVTQQVTDRRRLHESEERFRQVSENLTDHVVHVMDLDPFRISYVSPSYERIWKRSIESLYLDPQSFLERVHPEDRDRLLGAMSFQNRGKSSQVEYRLLFEDGSIRWIQDNSFPVMNSEGQAFRATGIAQDITERKFSETRLKESGAKLLTITNAIPQMVWSTLPDGYHDFYNDRWYAFTGVPPGSTDGEGWNQMFHPDDRDRAWKAWRHSLNTGDPYEIEYRLRHHSGNYRWTLGRALPVRDDSGQIIRWMGTCTDIQEIRETGEELTAAVQDLKMEREMRDKFVAALTHDMRTPLTSAKISGQLILKMNGDPSAVKSLAEQIVTDMDRADQMIRDLLDTNRIKAGEGIPLAIQPCQLDKVVQSTLTDLTRFHGPRFELRNEAGTVQGFWDCAGLRRVIENLAGNAVKYGHTDTSIILRLEQDAQSAELSVQNQGPVIPPEDLKTLFDPYRRTVSAMSGGQKGWGIGLTLVKGITDAHRGTVHVESSLENGTTFRVRLPRDSRS